MERKKIYVDYVINSFKDCDNHWQRLTYGDYYNQYLKEPQMKAGDVVLVLFTRHCLSPIKEKGVYVIQDKGVAKEHPWFSGNENPSGIIVETPDRSLYRCVCDIDSDSDTEIDEEVELDFKAVSLEDLRNERMQNTVASLEDKIARLERLLLEK